MKFCSSSPNRLMFNSRLHLVTVMTVIISNIKCNATSLDLAIESDYLALGNELVLLYSSWHRRSKSAAQAAHCRAGLEPLSHALHTDLSRILNSADSIHISPGLQNTWHSSIQFLATPF